VRTSNATAYHHRQEKRPANRSNDQDGRLNDLEKRRRDEFQPNDSIDSRHRDGIPNDRDAWEDRHARVVSATTKEEPLIRVLTAGEIEWGAGLLDEVPAMRDEDGDLADEFIMCDTF